MVEKGKQFIVNSAQPWIKQFTGQKVIANGTTGASGKTDLYNLTSGGGIYLLPEEVTPA